MSEVVERLIEQKKEEWRQEAYAEGRAEQKRIMIQDAFRVGIPVKTIAQFSRLSEEEVQEILSNAQSEKKNASAAPRS